MRTIVGAASLIVVAAGLKAAAPLLIPLVIALFLAVVCFPLVQWLRAHRVPTVLAITLTVLGILVVFTGPGAVVTAAVRQFIDAAPLYQEQLVRVYDGLLGWLRARGVETILLRDMVDPRGIVNFAVGSVSGIVTLLSVGFLIILVTAFMLAYGAALSGPPGTSVRHGRGTVVRIVNEVQIYLGVKTVVSAMTGLVAWSFLVILGIDFAMLWGLLTFLLNYVPNIGSVIAAVPPTLLALAQFGLAEAIFVLAAYVAINQFFGSFLEPYLMGQRLRLAPLAVLVSVVVWGWIWGPVGALLSVPITMVIKIGLENSAEFRWVAQLLEGRRPDIWSAAQPGGRHDGQSPEG